MIRQKMHALLVPLVVQNKALENCSKALYGTTIGTYSARVFRPVTRRGGLNEHLDAVNEVL